MQANVDANNRYTASMRLFLLLFGFFGGVIPVSY